MKAVKPPVSSCNCRSRSRCSIRSASVSTWPNIIVAVLRPPSSCQTRLTFEPVVGQHLAAGDRLAHAIDQNLRPAAGQAAQAGRLQPLEHRAQRQLRDLGEVVDLRRAEAVDVDLRKVRA